ncbi:MAG: DMT family transporter [Anaerolineae bacterium]|nr:MAG: DMT family transporter [Anaerolineae bacterium]
MKTKDWLAFAGLSLAWGSSFLWIKIALEEIGPVLLVALRLLVGLAGLAAVVAVRKPAMPREGKLLRALVVLGLINVAVPFTLISWGEVYIDSAVASVLNSTVPLFAAVVAHFSLTDDKLSGRRIVGLLIGFAGVVLLMWRDLSAGVQVNLLGQGAVLLAAVFYGVAAVYARKNTSGSPPMVTALVQVAAADAMIWIAAPIAEGPLVFPMLPLTWIALLWLGLIGSCLAYLLYFYLVHSIGPSRMAMVTYVFPVVGVTLGVLFLGEALYWQLIAGAALVIGSVGIVNSRQK